jgi:hypothetical protein
MNPDDRDRTFNDPYNDKSRAYKALRAGVGSY